MLNFLAIKPSSMSVIRLATKKPTNNFSSAAKIIHMMNGKANILYADKKFGIV
jgi:hypothetical protein